MHPWLAGYLAGAIAAAILGYLSLTIGDEIALAGRRDCHSFSHQGQDYYVTLTFPTSGNLGQIQVSPGC